MNKGSLLFVCIAFAATLLFVPAGFRQNTVGTKMMVNDSRYEVNLGASYIFLVHAANDLFNSK